MRINLNLNYVIEIPDCKVDTMIGGFKKLLPLILSEYVSSILLGFANWHMERDSLPFACEKCDGKVFHWKTRNAKPTTLKTIFGDLVLGQFQIQCNGCGTKVFITRKLLGVEKFRKMSSVTRRTLALLGSFTSFRVSEKILGMFGINLNRMSVWRCVQQEGESMKFDLDLNESPKGQADGTGIPIRGIKKRGKELKVFIQEKVGGGIRIAGLAIGNYEGHWDKLFNPILETLKLFPRFLLVTDGDSNILKGIKSLNIIFQRCLWHIPHQMKYYLWKDKVARKSEEYLEVMGRLLDITAIRRMINDEDEIASVVKIKTERLDELISDCEEEGWKHCATYLRNARPNMFTAFQKRLAGKTTSKVERVMRTVNMRVNVGKWSASGALNAVKVRLGHYYNGFDVPKIASVDQIKLCEG